MFHALDFTLRLTHPFMPFLTEGLWQELDPKTRGEVDGTSIMLSPFPNIHDFPEIDPSQSNSMEIVIKLIESLRHHSAQKKGVKRCVTILPPKDGSLTSFLTEKKTIVSLKGTVKIGQILSETQWDGVTGDEAKSCVGGWVFLKPGDGLVRKSVDEGPVIAYLNDRKSRYIGR